MTDYSTKPDVHNLCPCVNRALMLAFPPNTLHGFIAVKVGWRWLLPLLLPSLMVLSMMIKGQRGTLCIRPSSSDCSLISLTDRWSSVQEVFQCSLQPWKREILKWKRSGRANCLPDGACSLLLATGQLISLGRAFLT